MTLENVIKIIEKLPCSTLSYPFGDDVLVYKVMDKMFALLGTLGNKDKDWGLNLKCDPDDALAYRDIYENVIPGYHMNKKHWNSVYFDRDDSIPNDILIDMINESYALVVSKLTKKQKNELQTQSK